MYLGPNGVDIYTYIKAQVYTIQLHEPFEFAFTSFDEKWCLLQASPHSWKIAVNSSPKRGCQHDGLSFSTFQFEGPDDNNDHKFDTLPNSLCW